MKKKRIRPAPHRQERSGDQVEFEGVYFRCLCEGNALVAFSQPDAFAVEDELGRNWICHPIQTRVLDYIELLADPPEIDTVDGNLGGQSKTMVRIVYCTDASEVRTELAESVCGKTAI